MKKEALATTLYKRNAGESADFKVIAPNKLCGMLTVYCSEIPHYAYT